MRTGLWDIVFVVAVVFGALVGASFAVGQAKKRNPPRPNKEMFASLVFA